MSKIKFVRRYIWYRTTFYDIVYLSGRVRTVTADELPMTALNFMIHHTQKLQYDRYHGYENIYD